MRKSFWILSLNADKRKDNSKLTSTWGFTKVGNYFKTAAYDFNFILAIISDLRIDGILSEFVCNDFSYIIKGKLCTFLISIGYKKFFGLQQETPVWPKPPSPRWVEESSVTHSKSACTTGTNTICAILKPCSIWKGLFGKITHNNFEFPTVIAVDGARAIAKKKWCL